MKDTKFFDGTFKTLLAMTISAWLLYFAFVFFVGDGEGCTGGWFSNMFIAMALLAGVISALPLVYGLARLLFWPNTRKDIATWMSGGIVGFGIAVFVVVGVLFAIAASQLGCA